MLRHPPHVLYDFAGFRTLDSVIRARKVNSWLLNIVFSPGMYPNDSGPNDAERSKR